MNKHQEALDSLRKECKATYNEKGKRWYTSDKTKDERCNLLQELIDKETPMKTERNLVLCPKCNSDIGIALDYSGEIVSKDNYCCDCGQKIDWSDEG